MSLTPLLIFSLSNQLNALSGSLDKTEAFAAAQGENPDRLLALRLAPDMFPLTTQLRFMVFQAQEPAYRLRGDAVLEVRQESRDGGERLGTWAEARARVTDAASFLVTVRRDEFDAVADKEIAHERPTGMIFDMTGDQYVRDWALPQAAFPPDDCLRHSPPGRRAAREGRLCSPHICLPQAGYRTGNLGHSLRIARHPITSELRPFLGSRHRVVMPRERPKTERATRG